MTSDKWKRQSRPGVNLKMRSPFLVLSLLVLSLLACDAPSQDISMQEKLILACKDGDVKTATSLMEGPEKLDASEALVIAAETGNLDLISLFIRAPLKPRKLHKALIRACRNGHTNVIRRLTADQRCKPAHDHNAAIFVACCQGHVDAVKLLLKKDQVVRSINDNSLLAMACVDGNLEMVRVLGPFIKFHQPKSQSPLNDTPQSLLMKLCICSAQKGHLHIIDYLLSPVSSLSAQCTMADRFTVIDTLLGKQQKLTDFSINLISLLVSSIFAEPRSLDDKFACSVERKLSRVMVVLKAFMVFRSATMIGDADEGFYLPTELRQLIAQFALLN